MGIRVGIDLGTTFSAVARINADGKPEVIHNSFGEAVTPSVLCFQEDGSVLYGQDAKDMQLVGDTNTASFFKRAMGNDDYQVEYFGKIYSATDLSAILLRKLVEEAQEQCGERIDSAVITVPAYFAHKERVATIEAGKKAGLNVLGILNEPTAAAFAYGLMDRPGEQTVIIYDLGGGTFDVTIARISDKEIRILGSDGNHELGGKDWDDCIANYLATQFENATGVDLTEDDHAVNTCLVTAENVKKQLTSRDSVTTMVRCKTTSAQITVTEDKFEEISAYLLQNTSSLIEKLLSELQLSWRDITGVILVGGSTRMRMVSKYVKRMSGREPLHGVNVDEAVALGAAIRANINEDGMTPRMQLGEGAAQKPAFQYVLGAKKITDATAHALGMIAESEDRERYVNSIVIPKNEAIPAAREKKYNFNVRKKDNELEVYVLQGEYERCLDNTVIGKYVITGMEMVRKNPSVIAVSYSYDENGVIGVSAVQTETNRSLKVEKMPILEDMSWADGCPKDNDPPSMEADAILAIDLSGSMDGEPIEKARKAMLGFLDTVDSDTTRVGVVGYANEVKWFTYPTNDYDKVRRTIRGMKISDELGYGTKANPFPQIRDYVKKRPVVSSNSFFRHRKNEDNKERMIYTVILTDGEWFQGEAAVRDADVCKKQGVQIIALGFGDADYRFLKKIATTDEMASLTNLNDLGSSFSKIAQVISDDTAGSGIQSVR